MDAAPSTLYTIGHSSHPFERLLGLLRRQRVELVVDVRSRPYSRHCPQYNRETLQAALDAADVRYLHLGDALGGRPRQAGCTDPSGRVRYEWIRQKEFFQDGIRRLLEEAGRARTCLLCAEEDPARCHRHHLIAPALTARGVGLGHIRADGRIEPDESVALRATGGQLSLL